MDQVKDKDLSILAQSVLDGVATEEARGMASRAVQNHLSITLLNIINESNRSINKLNTILDRAVDIYIETLSARMDQDLTQNEELINLIDRVQSRQIQIAELYRKIIQSPKGLFSEDILSEEEKKVMKLFKSFKTTEERRKFLELCQQALNPEDASID